MVFSQNGTTCHSKLVGCRSAFCWNSSTPSARSLRFASSRPPEPVTQRCREIRACFPIVLCIWKMKASQGCPEIDRVEGRLAYDGLGRDVASTVDETTRVEPRGQINETRPIFVTTTLVPGDNYPANNMPTRPFRAANFPHADRISPVCFNTGQQA